MSAPVRLHRLESGPRDAPAILLVNSLGSTLDMWDPQVEVLSTAHRVIRSDLRGHGRSPVPDGPYTVAALGGDLVRLLDDLDVERASVCGLSLGGMAAMWLAAHAPGRVGRLVVCCTSARLGPPESWEARASQVRASGTGSVADLVVGRWFTPGFAARHPDRVAYFRAMIAGIPTEGYAGCCDAIAALDMRADLGAIAAPTLVIAGADDPAIPPDDLREVASGIPGARLIVVPDAAHLLNVEQAGAVTRLILDHVDGGPEATQ